MKELGWFAVFFSAVFTNNILLTNYLGMCSFLACSKEVKTAAGLGAAVTVVMAATSVLNWLMYYCILAPLHLEYLRFIVFIVVIAAFVQIVELIVERVSETLYAALGIFLPLITVNCAILGGSLFMVNNVQTRGYGTAEVFVYGLGTGLGWFIAIMLMAGIRRRLKTAKVPAALEGPGITLIIAGIMAMAFVIFQGMIRL